MNLRAVIFDMDGTLTCPQFDFDAIRQEIGIPYGPILEQVAHLTEAEQRRALAIVARHEREFAESSVLQTGAAELNEMLRHRGWRTALMTRNSRDSVEIFLQRHRLEFHALRSREDGPVKPSAEPVHDLCRALEVVPANAWVMGDDLFDLLSGRAAGTRTILKCNGTSLAEWHAHADAIARELAEVAEIIGL